MQDSKDGNAGGDNGRAPGAAPSIWLANVGANATHRFASPVFPDGTFEMLPIPESPADAGPHSVRYPDLRCFNPGSARDSAAPGGTATGTLGDWIPERLHGIATHYDPEFDTFTYGDNVERNARAAALRGILPGDHLFFIARLADWRVGGFTGRTGFYLVGFLEVESILAGVRSRPGADILDRFGANAHVRRGLNGPETRWDGFWVFGGSTRSRRLARAVPVDRALAERVFRRADGGPWRWGGGRTELQVIGSYTRACRRVIDPTKPGGRRRSQRLWDAVERVNPGVRPG